MTVSSLALALATIRSRTSRKARTRSSSRRRSSPTTTRCMSHAVDTSDGVVIKSRCRIGSVTIHGFTKANLIAGDFHLRLKLSLAAGCLFGVHKLRRNATRCDPWIASRRNPRNSRAPCPWDRLSQRPWVRPAEARAGTVRSSRRTMAASGAGVDCLIRIATDRACTARRVKSKSACSRQSARASATQAGIERVCVLHWCRVAGANCLPLIVPRL